VTPSILALPLRRGVRQGFLVSLALLLAAALTFGPPAAGGATAAGNRAGTAPRALVLAPFATDWGDVATNQQIASLLTQAGFAVTVYQDSQVTVPVMKTLSRYAFIYVATHVGPLPNGDAALATADTRHMKYQKYLNNYSLAEMHILHNGAMRWFDAANGRFIHFYDGQFPAHTVVLTNACNTADMPLFWHYLKQAGVGTLIGWHHHIYSGDGDRTALTLLQSMLRGESMSQAVKDVIAAGESVSPVAGQKKPGTLDMMGDGTVTLQRITGVAPAPVTPPSTGSGGSPY